jgi:hypothetical protein
MDGPTERNLKTKTFLKLFLLNAELDVVCYWNSTHYWTSYKGEFLFRGVWERGKVEGTFFDKEISSMPMPTALSLNEYELDIKKGKSQCPLCRLEGKTNSELHVYDWKSKAEELKSEMDRDYYGRD